jgi:hypothetical protein
MNIPTKEGGFFTPTLLYTVALLQFYSEMQPTSHIFWQGLKIHGNWNKSFDFHNLSLVGGCCSDF